MTEPGPRARREYGAALVLIAGGGLLLLFAYGLPWGSADVPLLAGSDGAVRAVPLTGRDLFPAAAMSGWIALAGVGGIVATRSWGRILVSGLCMLAGVAGAVVAVAFGAAPAGHLDSAVVSLAGPAATVPSSATLAWVAAAGAGAVVALTGGWAGVRGRHWPRLGSRYERAPRTERTASTWEAQDMGHDPTDDLVE